MAGLISVATVGAGAVTAWAAARMPAHVEALETVAGVMLIAGFALIGCALPVLV